LLLVQAVWRLGARAWEAIASGQMSAAQWLLLVVVVIFMAWSEGYRGFQKAFSPRVVLRAFHLSRHPDALTAVAAPLFCMGLIGATRRRMTVSWVLVVGIVVLVGLVRLLDQPWRGIVDAGVVVGLAWGIVSILVFFLRTLAGSPPPGDLDLPAAAHQLSGTPVTNR
jgi:hypothetical protein